MRQKTSLAEKKENFLSAFGYLVKLYVVLYETAYQRLQTELIQIACLIFKLHFLRFLRSPCERRLCKLLVLYIVKTDASYQNLKQQLTNCASVCLLTNRSNTLLKTFICRDTTFLVSLFPQTLMRIYDLWPFAIIYSSLLSSNSAILSLIKKCKHLICHNVHQFKSVLTQLKVYVIFFKVLVNENFGNDVGNAAQNNFSDNGGSGGNGKVSRFYIAL